MGKGRVAIIGGGASGMIAAIAARRGGAAVVVFDTNQSFGKKILKTGNGRCNFSNSDLASGHFHSGAPSHVKNVLSTFGLNETLELFKGIGIEPKLEGNLYYPYSMQARAVRDCILSELAISGIEMRESKKVTGIKADGKRYIIETESGVESFDACILACGGMASPESGSDGNGYVLARNLGHNIIKPLPALTPLVGDDMILKDASGIRMDANVTLDIEGKKYKETGNLQITDYGISGICTMQLSVHAGPALSEGKKVSAYLDFLPEKKANEVKAMVDERFKTRAKSKSAATALLGLLPDKLAVCVVKKCGIKPQEAAVNVSPEALKLLCTTLKGYRLDITGMKGFTQAQTTLGGVDLNDVDKKTLESRISKGIYFCGEILDVCGDCGGYNLQWAISSGFVAGTSCAGGM